MNLTAEYEGLRELGARLGDLGAAMSVLQWDLEVMAPPGGAARRAAQIGTLAGLRHEFLLERYRPAVLRLAEIARDEAKRWMIAHRTERQVAGTLAPLTAQGYTFLHDRGWPESSASTNASGLVSALTTYSMWRLSGANCGD